MSYFTRSAFLISVYNATTSFPKAFSPCRRLAGKKIVSRLPPMLRKSPDDKVGNANSAPYHILHAQSLLLYFDFCFIAVSNRFHRNKVSMMF